MKRENQFINELEFWKLMVSGGIGGVAFWMIVYPIDIGKEELGKLNTCS